MTSTKQFIDEARASLPEPGDDPISHLRHALAAFGKQPDDEMVLTATWGVYGDNVKTGVTMGDLRALLAMVEKV